MNEEEKEVINDLKDFISDDSDLISYDLTMYETKLILDLIKKQQKEIEDLKSIIKTDDIMSECDIEYIKELRENYISKEKIRKLKKRVHNYLNITTWGGIRGITIDSYFDELLKGE